MKGQQNRPTPSTHIYDHLHGLKLDLYLAPEPGPSPLVVYLHGGGFRGGSRQDHVDRLINLSFLGLNVASIDYRLAPEWRYPAPVDDVLTAVAFLRKHAGPLGLDARAIGLIGASAGGTLAALAATKSVADPQKRVQAVSIWFCATDFVESVRRTPLEQRVQPLIYEANLFGDCEDSELLAAASPARADLGDAPPFLIIHGDSDKIVPVEQAKLMHFALDRANRDSTLIRLAGLGHEDPAFDGGPLLALCAAWLREHLSQPTTELTRGTRREP